MPRGIPNAKKETPATETPAVPPVAPEVETKADTTTENTTLPNPPAPEEAAPKVSPQKVVARILEEGELPPPVMDEGTPIRVTEENGIRRLDY